MQFRHKSLILLLMATAAAGAIRPAFGSLQPVHARHGIVVSAHELASRAGVDIMRAGGNAVDAAAATGFALAVVHPAAGNLGGGGFMLIRLAGGKTHFLDYRERAPAAATRDMYLDTHGDVVEGASEFGYKAIGVPGSVAGMVYADQKYGKLTLKQVMAPAIRLARGLSAELGRSARSARQAFGRLRRVAANFSARRQLLSAGRDFSAAGIGSYSGADRREPG